MNGDDDFETICGTLWKKFYIWDTGDDFPRDFGGK